MKHHPLLRVSAHVPFQDDRQPAGVGQNVLPPVAAADHFNRPGGLKNVSCIGFVVATAHDYRRAGHQCQTHRAHRQVCQPAKELDQFSILRDGTIHAGQNNAAAFQPPDRHSQRFGRDRRDLIPSLGPQVVQDMKSGLRIRQREHLDGQASCSYRQTGQVKVAHVGTQQQHAPALCRFRLEQLDQTFGHLDSFDKRLRRLADGMEKVIISLPGVEKDLARHLV